MFMSANIWEQWLHMDFQTWVCGVDEMRAIEYVSVKPLELLAHWTWETDEIDKHSSFEIGEGNIQIQRNLIIPSTVFQLNVHFKSHNSIFLYYISIVGPDTGLFK